MPNNVKRKEEIQRRAQYLSAGGTALGAGAFIGMRERPVKYRVYMGGNEGVSAKPISQKRITAFRRRVLNKYLPGYTLSPAHGYWTEAGKEASEATKVLEYIGKAKESGNIRDIANSYGRVFKQSSVLMTREPVTPRFLKPGQSGILRALRRVLGRK